MKPIEKNIELPVTKEGIVKTYRNKKRKESPSDLQRLYDVNEMFIEEDVLNATGTWTTKFVEAEEKFIIDKTSSEVTKGYISDKMLIFSDEKTISNITVTFKKNVPENMNNAEISTNLKKLKSFKSMLEKYECVQASKHVALDLNESIPYINQSIISTSHVESKDTGDCEAFLKSFRITKEHVKKHEEEKNIFRNIPRERIIHLKDKTYYFLPKLFVYKCKVCMFEGENIVTHYKKKHPHLGVPISRFSPEVAREAIRESLSVKILEFNNTESIPKKKYCQCVCRFCFKTFYFSNLRQLFRHIISKHTGEYEYNCFICIESGDEHCKFNINIPSPPTISGGMLLGHMCGTCNYVQLSLENLKTHITSCHSSEETTIHCINMRGLCLSEKKPQIETKYVEIKSDGQSTSSSHYKEISSNSEKMDTFNLINKENYSSKAVSLGEDILKNRNNFEVNSFNKSNPNPNLCRSSDESFQKSNDIICQQEWRPISNLTINNDCISIMEDAPEIKEEVDNDVIGAVPNSIKDANESYDPRFGCDLLHEEIIINLSDDSQLEFQCKVINNCGFVNNNILNFDSHLKEAHGNQVWNGYCSICKEHILPTFAQPNYTDGFYHLMNYHTPLSTTPVPEVLVNRTEYCIANQCDAIIKSERDEMFPQSTIDNISLNKVEYDEDISQNDMITASIRNTRNIQVPVEPGFVAIPKNKSQSSVCFKDDSFKSQLVEKPEHAIDRVIILEKTPSTSLKKDIIDYHGVTKSVSTKDDNELVSFECQNGKIPAVLETMFTLSKMVCMFKCAGRTCSYCSRDATSFIMHLRLHITLVLSHDLNDQSFLECLYCKINNTETGFELKATSPQLLVNHIILEHGHCMYGCSHCFYIASTARLVELHRVHNHPLKPAHILRLIQVNESDDTVEMKGVLTYKDAVLPYQCNQGNCNHSSYGLEDFALHLRGHKERQYACFLCQAEQSQVSLLLCHMEIMHNLALYQCAFCKHGADDELDMLRHCSLQHPMRKPAAYKRENDENPQVKNEHDERNQTKVFPLVSFDQSISSDILSVLPADVDNSNEHVLSAVRLLLQENEVLSKEAKKLEVSNIDTNHVIKSVTPFETNRSIKMRSDKAVKDPIEQEKSNKIRTYSKISKVIDSAAKTAIAEATFIESDEDVEFISNSTNNEKLHNSNQQSTSALVLTETNSSLKSETRVMQVDDIILLSDDESSGNSLEILEETFDGDRVTSSNLSGPNLYGCGKCLSKIESLNSLYTHVRKCYAHSKEPIHCYHCRKTFIIKDFNGLIIHMIKEHGKGEIYICDICRFEHWYYAGIEMHMSQIHKVTNLKRISDENVEETQQKGQESDLKVTYSLQKHTQNHIEKDPTITSINSAPNLNSVVKETNLAFSSHVELEGNKGKCGSNIIPATFTSPYKYPKYVSNAERYACGAIGCYYRSVDEERLKRHWKSHTSATDYKCVHCPHTQTLDPCRPLTSARILVHLKMHDSALFACSDCKYYHYREQSIERHINQRHNNTSLATVITLRDGVEKTVVDKPT